MSIETPLTELRTRENTYIPNDTIRASLAEKQLVMLVSPFAVGKSTLMNRMCQLDNRFARISGLTTRPPRAEDEPDMYRYLSHNEPSLTSLLEKVRAGELVQYAMHPTTGFVYATELMDYPAPYNCKDVLGHAVAGFRALPSGGSHTFGIVCQPEEWQQRIRTRYPNDSPELQKRLQEARLNLEWSLADSQIIWVENATNQLDAAAHAITAYATNEHQPDTTQQHALRRCAQAMLEFTIGQQ